VKPEWGGCSSSPEEQRSQTVQAFHDPATIQIAVAGSGSPKDVVFAP
jgi:hypothetical protein